MPKELRDLPDNFQLEHLNSALCFVKNFDMAIDVGAHRGIWTKRMLDFFNKVVAIEPTDLHEKIQKDDKLQIINAACGARRGRCSIASGLRNSGQSHVVEGDTVNMITLDSLNLSPDFIKIDVEGMEFDVIKGARETIIRSKPLIMIEENILSEKYGNYIGRANNLLKKWGMKKLVTFHVYPEKDKNILLGW